MRQVSAQRAGAVADTQTKAVRALGVERAMLRARTHAARRDADTALARARASEKHFAQLVAANFVGVFVAEHDRITATNDAFLRLAGYTRADLEAGLVRWSATTRAEGAPLDERALIERQGRDTCTPFETEYVRADGRRIPVLVGATTLEREPPRWVCFVVDLSAYKQLERERAEARAEEAALREVNQHLDEFFAIAVHDIRNPVNAAQNSVDLARLQFERLAGSLAQSTQQAALLERLSASLEVAGQSLERLARITIRLFDVAQARDGELEVRPTPCDLAAVVREQVEMLRVAAPGRRVGLKVPDARPVWVLADADRLGEVLANYVTNALNYSPDDQPVWVRLEIVGGAARVAVRDHGPGMSPADQQRVWELFYRAPGGEVQSGSGIGLGLYICRTIIERHGGRVGVESAVGKGSTFWFTLPLDPAASSPRASVTAHNRQEAADSGRPAATCSSETTQPCKESRRSVRKS
jgi:PAS domain S-box-containing protein